MKKIFWMVPCLALALASCTNENEEQSLDMSRALDVKVRTEMAESRAPITGTTLTAGDKIGVSLYADGGTAAYDGTGTEYQNMLYKTANGTAFAREDEDGNALDAPSLSSSEAWAVAYYPWNNGVDPKAISIETASQTDYLYSGWVQDKSNKDNSVTFVMKHAMSIVRVALSNNGYTGGKEVSKISIQSKAYGTAATLDATTGTLTAITGQETEIATGAWFTPYNLADAATNTDFLVIQDTSKEDQTLKVNVTIGSTDFTASITLDGALGQGLVHTIGLSLSGTGLSVTGVSVAEWSTDVNGNGQDDDSYTGDLGLAS